MNRFASKYHLQFPWPDVDYQLRAPVSGLLLAELDGPTYLQNGLLGEFQQIHLQGNQLRAPFQGRCIRRDQSGSLVSFIHPQGLRLDISFPEAYQQHGLGFHWHVATDAEVQANQAIVTFDCTLLQQWLAPAQCLVQLHDHPKIQRIYTRTGYVEAGKDALFGLTFLATTAPTST